MCDSSPVLSDVIWNVSRVVATYVELCVRFDSSGLRRAFAGSEVGLKDGRGFVASVHHTNLGCEPFLYTKSLNLIA